MNFLIVGLGSRGKRRIRCLKNLGYKKGDFPISESVSDRVFSIPMHPYLTSEQQDMIIDSLNNE